MALCAGNSRVGSLGEWHNKHINWFTWSMRRPLMAANKLLTQVDSKVLQCHHNPTPPTHSSISIPVGYLAIKLSISCSPQGKPHLRHWQIRKHKFVFVNLHQATFENKLSLNSKSKDGPLRRKNDNISSDHWSINKALLSLSKLILKQISH